MGLPPLSSFVTTGEHSRSRQMREVARGMFSLDLLQTLLRAVLKVGGGYLLAKGVADNSGVEAITAGVVALAGVVWGVLHRAPAKTESRQVELTTLPLLFVALAITIGCASANSVAFRTEKLATDAAYAPLQAWKAYYFVALTNSPEQALADLTNRNERVYSASRSFAAAMRTADAVRESCVRNASVSNQTALRITLEVTCRSRRLSLAPTFMWVARTHQTQIPTASAVYQPLPLIHNDRVNC